MNNNPFALDGKTILITGAASGIGQATAVQCSNMGATVIITDVNQRGLLETYSLLDSDRDNQYFISDLTNSESVDSMINSLPLLNGFSSVAGIPSTAPIQFFKRDVVEKVFNINTFAPVFFMKALLNKKKLAKSSSVVFVASLAGVKHYTIGNGVYGMSKSAIDSFMHFAAIELASKGIRCNSVNPALVETSLSQSLNRSDESRIDDLKKYPLKRYGTPEDIANAIVFLLSNASSWITGHSLIIDGGRTLY